MAKKYKQDREDRMDERRGMRKRGGFMEGHDESIGKGEHANMPKDVRMESYPRAAVGRSKDIDDSMSDIDEVQSEGASRRNRYMSDQK